MFSGNGIHAIAEVLVIAVLARLLTPENFGVVTAGLVIIKFSSIFSTLGISPAIVQRPKLETRHIRTGFTLSCFFSILLAGLFIFMAPSIAGFFKMQKLIPVLCVLSVVFPIQGVSLVAESLLQREIKFSWIAGINALSYTLGYGIIGITLASAHFGMWALVAGHVSQMAFKCLSLLIVQPHPKLPLLERRAVKELMFFGGGLTLARLANTTAGQGSNFIVGRWLGAEALGLYGRAFQLMVMPAQLIGMALDKVIFPAMAKVQHQQDRLQTAYRRGLSLTALVVLPTSAAMFVLSPEIIEFLFGPAWLEAVIPFKILSVGMLFRTSYKLSDSLARATGAVYRRAWRQGLYAGCMLGGAWIGQFWGLNGVACGVLGAVTVNFILMAHLSMKLVSMTWRVFLAAHLPAVQLTILVWVGISYLALVLRDLAMPLIIVLFTPIISIGLLVFLFLYLAPHLILGKDNIPVLQSLFDFIPTRYYSPKIIKFKNK
ncbi:MAG: lipopolysaccharide biosynthesis protein [Nitrospiraceae bacterium]|nr:MAG: lipopolysaccharide biosynthesis protein [Nitrospiraceae bacterium]